MDPFNPFARFDAGFSFDPSMSYARMFTPRQPTARELLPPVDPETEQSTAGWLLEEGLGGLGYLGSVLDKSFGTRGVRGLIGGRPEELLSVLPLSDTLGFTDQANEVTGRELLADLGVTSRRRPDEPFNWQDDLLGMVAEIALDPSTYLSLGLTGVGKAALKTGGRSALAKGIGPQLRANQRGLTMGIPFTGMETDFIPGPQVSDALSWMRSGATFPTRAADYVSAATTGYRPFSGAQRLAYENVLEPLGRYGRSVFTPAVKEASSPEGQAIGEVYSGVETAGERQALEDQSKLLLRLDEMLGVDATPELRQEAGRALTQAVEAGDPMTMFPEKQLEAKQRAVKVIEKWLTPADPNYDVDRANLTEWIQGKKDLNDNNQTIFDTQVDRMDQAFVKGTLPTASTDMLQEMPNRDRFRAEAVKVWGEDANEYMPVMDNFAKRMAKKLGVTPDDYYKTLYSRVGGTPGRRALQQDPTEQVDVFKNVADRYKTETKQEVKSAGDMLKAFIVSDSKLAGLADSILEAADGESLQATMRFDAKTPYPYYSGSNHEIVLRPTSSEKTAIHEIAHAFSSRKIDKSLTEMIKRKGVSKYLGKDVSKGAWRITDGVTGKNYIQMARDLVADTEAPEPVRSLFQSYLDVAENKGFLDKLKGGAKEEVPGKEVWRKYTGTDHWVYHDRKKDPGGSGFLATTVDIRKNADGTYSGELHTQNEYRDYVTGGKTVKQQFPDEASAKQWTKEQTGYEFGDDVRTPSKQRAAAGLAGLPHQVTREGLPYGIGNIDEFIAEAMSNKSFQELLMTMPAKTGEPNLFVKFINAIRGILGLNDNQAKTLLDSVLSDVEELAGIERQNLKGYSSRRMASEADDLPEIAPSETGALRRQDEIPAKNLFLKFDNENKRMPETSREALEVIATSNSKLKDLAADLLKKGDEDGLSSAMKWDDTIKETAVYDPMDNSITTDFRRGTDYDIVHEITHGMTLRKVYRDMANHVVATNPELAAKGTVAVNEFIAQNLVMSKGAEHLDTVRQIADSKHVSEPVRELHKAYLKVAENQGILDRLGAEGIAGAPSRRALESGLPYGMTNVGEFIAESLTDAKFQDLLKSIPAGEGRNLFQRMMDSVKKMLGLSGPKATMFDEVVDQVNKLAGTDLKAMHSNAARAVPDTGMELFQGAQGSFEVMKSGKRVMRALQGADLSTFAHETAHDMTYMLSQYDPKAADELAVAVGAKDYATITRDQHEIIARGWEKYLRDGMAPLPALQRAFNAMRDFLVDIYKSIVGTPLEGKLNPELRAQFDKLLREGDDIAMPRDTPSVTLLDALRDKIDSGILPEMMPDSSIRMAPSNELIRESRKWIRNQIKKDDTLGPRAFKDPNDPSNLVQSVYSRELGKFSRNLDYDPATLFADPVIGASAKQAFDKLQGDPQYARAMKIEKALDYTPPKGPSQISKWADANLTPDQKKIFDEIAVDLKWNLMKWKEMEKAVGARGGSLSDAFIQYMTRTRTKYPADDPRSKTLRSMSQYWKDLKASNEAFTARKEIFRDIPGGTSTIDEWAMDPELSGAARTMTDEQVMERLRLDMVGTAQPARDNPAWKQAEKLSKWLKELPPDHVTSKIPYFSADIPQLMFNRQQGMSEVMAVAQATNEALLRFAKPAKDFGDTPTMKVKELLTRLNLTGSDQGGSIWAQIITGTPAKGELKTLDDIGDLSIDMRTAEDMLKINQASATPRVLQPVIEGYDYLSNLTKTYLTRPFVSFHTRNLLSSLFNTWRSTGAVGTSRFKTVVDFLNGKEVELIPGVNKDQLWTELVAGRIAFTPNATNQADFVGAGGEIVQQGIRRPLDTGKGMAGRVVDRVKKIATEPKNPFNTKNGFVQAMTDAGQWVEDFGRVNHYVELRNQGWSPKAASEEVMKYQIDYRNLTNTERSFFRRMFPWYSFSRGTLPTILSDLVDKPSNITMPMRLVTGGRTPGEFVPEWIGEGAALPLGVNEDGSQRYVSSFGLPIEDEAFKMLGSLIKGDPTRVGEQVLGATFPWIKFPLEAIFGKQLYSGRPLADLQPYNWSDLGGLLNEKQARLLTEVVSQTPASRVGSTASRLMDERKSASDQLLSMLTGARMTDVDVARAFPAAVTREVGAGLVGQPGVRTRQEVYVPIENIPRMTPKDAEEYALYLAYEQKMRDLAAKRKEQAAGLSR